MKSSTVWHGHSTRPSLPAGTARKASGSLPRGRRNRLISLAKKNRAFPTGNALLYISLSYVDFSGCVRVDAPCFCFAFNFLTHDSQPHSSDIPSDCHSESNPHSLAGHCTTYYAGYPKEIKDFNQITPYSVQV